MEWDIHILNRERERERERAGFGLGLLCFLSALLCWLLVAWLFNTRKKDMDKERERGVNQGQRRRGRHWNSKGQRM